MGLKLDRQTGFLSVEMVRLLCGGSCCVLTLLKWILTSTCSCCFSEVGMFCLLSLRDAAALSFCISAWVDLEIYISTSRSRFSVVMWLVKKATVCLPVGTGARRQPSAGVLVIAFPITTGHCIESIYICTFWCCCHPEQKLKKQMFMPLGSCLWWRFRSTLQRPNFEHQKYWKSFSCHLEKTLQKLHLGCFWNA